MIEPKKLFFLPGASGNVTFWWPAASKLAHPATKFFVTYPGFEDTPSDTKVNSLDTLVASIIDSMDCPTAIIAQSMGGIIAVRAALECPQRVTHLILVATSGGMDMLRLGAKEWRTAYLQDNPHLPDWFVKPVEDMTPHLRNITIPVLLLWGDTDPISPVAAGKYLQEHLPYAELHVIKDGKHDFAMTHAASVAPLIDAYLLR